MAANFEQRLAYHFKQPALQKQALTHRSHSQPHNERLEFLGDSVLNCVVALMLYERFGNQDEGDLSRIRANLVCQDALHNIAQTLDIAKYLHLGEGELKSGGLQRPSILADALEAIFGAVFLDGGFSAAEQMIRALYAPYLSKIQHAVFEKDSKTLLQEFLQARKIPVPVYKILATNGAGHAQEFQVACTIEKLQLSVTASGRSRRNAEQAAAKIALDAVEKQIAGLTRTIDRHSLKSDKKMAQESFKKPATRSSRDD